MSAGVAPALPPAVPLSGRELAIARSVMYASLFDYPLSLAQLRQTLVGSAQTPTEILEVYAHSVALQAAIDHQDHLFFPAGRQDLIAERRAREERSRAFLRRHRTMLTLACALPYVRMVALSGSVAHLNLEGSGDLDLFIITRPRRVWFVTVAVVLLAKLLRRRRTVCANFVLSDDRLVLDQQDLFTASQIIHLKPLVGMDVYEAFLEANPFVSELYPNFHRALARVGGLRIPALPRILKATVEWMLTAPSAAGEVLCRWAYRGYLRRRSGSWRSPEQVRLDNDCVKLHTQSHRQSILDRLEQATRNLEDTESRAER